MSVNPSGHGGRPFTKDDPRAKPFPKGTSGNPGGRPRSVSHYIRQQTDDGIEIVDFYLLIMRKGSLKMRMDAGRELFDRGWGRPMVYHALNRQESFMALVETLGKKAVELFGEEAWQKIYDAARTAIVESRCSVDEY